VPPAPLKTLLTRADRAAAWFEATQLAGFSETEAARFFPRPRFRGAADIRLDPQPTAVIHGAFIERFRALEARL